MAIAFRATTGMVTGTTSIVLTVPSGCQNGDVLLAFIGDKATAGAGSAPSGWTRQVGIGNASAFRGQLFYAIVGQGGVSASQATTFTGFTSPSIGAMVAYSGCDLAVGSSLFDATPTARGNASGATGSGSIAAVSYNDLVVMAFISNANGSTWSAAKCVTNPTTGVTDRVSAANGSTNSIYIADAPRNPANTVGATGASSATMGTPAANPGLMAVLRPAGTSTALTGPAISSDVGTVSVSTPASGDVTVFPTGVAVSAAVGPSIISSDVVVSPAGLSITAATNALTSVVGSAQATPLGQVLSSAAGSMTVTAGGAIDVSVGLTGGGLAASGGMLIPSGSAEVAALGDALSSAVGMLDAAAVTEIAVLGQVLTSTVGTVSTSAIVGVSVNVHLMGRDITAFTGKSPDELARVFDDLLLSSCTIYRRHGVTHNSYGISDQTLVLIEDFVACRLSGRAPGQEFVDPKQVNIERWKLFMRPRISYRLSETHFIVLENRFFEITSIDEPREHDSNIVHHLEIYMNEIQPSDVPALSS